MEIMNSEKPYRQCYGCKAQFPYVEASESYQTIGIARYGVASAECIAAFCDVLGKEQEWAGYPPIHRLFIDAYAVQHPPHREIQEKLGIDQRLIDASIQSIVIHLIALYLAFEKKLPLQSISKQMAHILDSKVKLEELQLEAPSHLGGLTIVNIQKAANFKEYEKLVEQWALVSWNAWKKHHDTIRKYYEEMFKSQETR